MIPNERLKRSEALVERVLVVSMNHFLSMMQPSQRQRYPDHGRCAIIKVSVTPPNDTGNLERIAMVKPLSGNIDSQNQAVLTCGSRASCKLA